MVLTYPDPTPKDEHQLKVIVQDTNVAAEGYEDEDDEKRIQERMLFEKNLRDSGLDLELEPSQVRLMLC